VLCVPAVIDTFSTYQILGSLAALSKYFQELVFTDLFWRERHLSHIPDQHDNLLNGIPPVFQRILRESPYLLVTYPSGPLGFRVTKLQESDRRGSRSINKLCFEVNQARIDRRELFFETLKSLSILGNKKFGNLDWTLTPFGRYFILHLGNIINRSYEVAQMQHLERAFLNFIRVLPGDIWYFNSCLEINWWRREESRRPPCDHTKPGYDICLHMRLIKPKWWNTREILSWSPARFHELCREFVALPSETSLSLRSKIAYLILGCHRAEEIQKFEVELINTINESSPPSPEEVSQKSLVL